MFSCPFLLPRHSHCCRNFNDPRYTLEFCLAFYPSAVQNLLACCGKIYNTFGCILVHTSAYLPQGNSIAEHLHGTVNILVYTAFAMDHSNMWIDTLPTVPPTISYSPAENHPHSPFSTMFGWPGRLPGDNHLVPHVDPPLLDP